MKKSTRVTTKPFSKNFSQVREYIVTLQKSIRDEISLFNIDAKGQPVGFKEVNWRHREQGGGRTLLIQSDNSHGEKCSHTFEKAGCNVSALGGTLPISMAKMFNTTNAKTFSACGLSLVFHPYSPLIPTVHMNVRYFEMSNGDYWFGGGIDLTPYYPSPSDFCAFHQTLKDAVQQIYPNRYERYKRECDEYFYLPHRKEMRGIGGIFFDYHRGNYEKDFSLIRSVGDAFLPSYIPIVKKFMHKAFTQSQKDFQLYRRGRYVEFNLLYDRGTLFGLKTGGRIESILMSLPLEASFITQAKFKKDGFERKMNKYYQPRKWV